MRRPSAVRTGMFCRLGSDDASLPVTAVAWLNVVCTRPVRGLTICGSLSVYVDFSFDSARCSSSTFGSGIVGGELGQHVLVRRRLARCRLAHRRQLHLVEQDLAQLLRRREVEGLPGELIGLVLQRHDLGAELAALRREQRRVEHHAFALHLEQHFAHGHLDRRVDVVELGIGGDPRIQELVQLQRDVGILGRVGSRVVDAHLIEADLLRALAGHLRVGDRLDVQVPPREVVHVVRPMRLEHVRLEQRVVRDAREDEAVIREHVLVVLHVLPELLPQRVGEPGREPRERRVERQLVGHSGVAVRERDVAREPGLDGERQPDDLRLHRVEAGRFGIEAHEWSARDRLHPALERRARPARFRSGAERPAADRTPLPHRARPARRNCACPGAARERRVRQHRRADPTLLSSRSQLLNSNRSYSDRSAIGMRRAGLQVGRRDRQRAIGLHGQQPLALRQPVERRAQVLADDAGDLARVLDHGVERAVLREPLRRRLRPDLRHARHVVDGVAGEREQIEHLIGAHAELGERRPPRPGFRCSSC